MNDRRELLIRAILATATDIRYLHRKTPDTVVRMKIRPSVLAVLTVRDLSVLEDKYNIIMERRDDIDQ